MNHSSTFSSRFSLSGKVALVTGAKSGIGEAIARAFLEEGASVIFADRDYEEVNLIETSSFADSEFFVKLDVSNTQDVDETISKVLERFFKIDILVNCAGIGGRSPAVDYSDELWEKVIAVNLGGIFKMSRAVGREMIRHGGGSIINIASVGGIVGYPGSVGYQASKGGVVQLTKSLAVEWAPHAIRVNAIAPGQVATKLVREQWASEPSLKLFFETRTPMGHLAETRDIVGGVIFLASDSSKMVTGQVLAIDGGFTAQ